MNHDRRPPTELQLKLVICLQDYAPRGLSIGDLARATKQNRVAVERRLYALGKRGWVRRRPAPKGRRAKYVFRLAPEAKLGQLASVKAAIKPP